MARRHVSSRRRAHGHVRISPAGEPRAGKATTDTVEDHLRLPAAGPEQA
ncbi:hypothetical protein ABZ883_34710 [Streptomyces sp. NPDC046977]